MHGHVADLRDRSRPGRGEPSSSALSFRREMRRLCVACVGFRPAMTPRPSRYASLPRCDTPARQQPSAVAPQRGDGAAKVQSRRWRGVAVGAGREAWVQAAGFQVRDAVPAKPQIDECRTAELRSDSGQRRWPLRHSKIDIRQSAVPTALLPAGPNAWSGNRASRDLGFSPRASGSGRTAEYRVTNVQCRSALRHGIGSPFDILRLVVGYSAVSPWAIQRSTCQLKPEPRALNPLPRIPVALSRGSAHCR
jgi:hypothetical protein